MVSEKRDDAGPPCWHYWPFPAPCTACRPSCPKMRTTASGFQS